jgi:transposase
MLTTPGIGETSASQILGELAVLPHTLDARQWVAFAGLDPRQFTSGNSVEKKPRISRGGSRHLRRALYMPALVAIRHEPYLRAFYQRLLARWKSPAAGGGGGHEKNPACFFRHVPLRSLV